MSARPPTPGPGRALRVTALVAAAGGLVAAAGGLVAWGVWAIRLPDEPAGAQAPSRQLAAPPHTRTPEEPPVEADGPDPEAPDPAAGPTLERPEVDARFADHAAAVRPKWRRVGALLEASDQPDLQGVAVEIEGRLGRAVTEDWPRADRADLVHEQRQLVTFLRQRYAGFGPLEGPLADIDAELTRMDGGAN